MHTSNDRAGVHLAASANGLRSTMEAGSRFVFSVPHPGFNLNGTGS
jgi:hypothetical protein